MNNKLLAADVGAHGGVVEHWLPFLEHMQVEAFEPNAEDCARQQKISPVQVQWNPIGLSETTGKHKLYVLNRPTGSSLYPPNLEIMPRFSTPDYHGLDKVLEVSCQSLADFYKSKGHQGVHLLKMDTQGAELSIMKGMSEGAWQNLLAIETEVEFLELYKDQPLFADVDAFLQKQGFELWDLRTHRAHLLGKGDQSPYIKKYLKFYKGTRDLSAQLVAGDALYFRKLETLKRDQFDSMLLISLIYGAFDRFFETLEFGKAQGFVSQEVMEQWIRVARKHAPIAWPWLRSSFVVRVIQKINSIFGTHILDGYRAFWTWRAWPDQ